MEFAVAQFGRLDILHNNVGIGGRLSTPDTIDLAEWQHVFETNLTSALLCCRTCILRMRAGGGGAIINVSSLAGVIGLSGSPGAVAYTTTKADCKASRCRSRPNAAENIRANCLLVGTVNTPMVSELGADALERRRKSVPLQTEGTPDGMSGTPPSIWPVTRRGG